MMVSDEKRQVEYLANAILNNEVDESVKIAASEFLRINKAVNPCPYCGSTKGFDYDLPWSPCIECGGV